MAAHEDSRRVVTLMAPIVHSTFILAAVLLVGIAAPLLCSLQVVLQNLAICRDVSYGLLTALKLWQLSTVVLTLVPASQVTTQANRDEAMRKTAAAVFSGAKPRAKRPGDRRKTLRAKAPVRAAPLVERGTVLPLRIAIHPQHLASPLA